MLDIIREQLQNQFLSGGMVLMVFGAALALMRSLPSQLFRLLHRKFVTTVDVSDQDRAFYWIQQWLSAHAYSKRCTLLTITTKACDVDEHKSKPEVLFSPAPGLHLLRFEKRFILLTCSRHEMTSGVGRSDRFWRESFAIRTLGQDRDFLRRLVLEAREHSGTPDDQVSILVASYGEWIAAQRCQARGTDSVLLPGDLMEELVDEVTTFFATGDWYHDRGIPYRMGYLLYGPPGTGKTSLALALASHFHRDLYLLRLDGVNEGELRNLMGSIPVHALLLVEDVDCNFEGRKAVATEAGSAPLSFSSFLNAIDGVAGPEGRLLLLTTNHPEKLDAALVRPGRVDRKIEFQNATPDQARRLFLRFFPGDLVLAERFAEGFGDGTHSMADLQGLLLRHRDSAAEAVGPRAANANDIAANADSGHQGRSSRIGPTPTQAEA